MGRLVSAGSIVRAQLDFFNSPTSIVRVPGISIIQTALTTFVDNSILGWSMVDGTLIPDASVASGYIYFNEITSSPGFYSIRFFPDRIGFWRIILLCPSLSQEKIIEFDVVAATTFAPTSTGGLNASFVK